MALDIHKAREGIQTLVDFEHGDPDWCPDYEDVILEHAVYMWIASGSILPPTEDEILDRDKIWDKACSDLRHALQFQLDGLKGS